MKIIQKAGSYLQLMKPSIMLLVLVTGATSLVLEGSIQGDKGSFVSIKYILILFGLLMTGGSANAFNMYFEREIDARMSRTMKRRPLPLGKISPWSALVFAMVIGVIGVAIFWTFFNMLSAILALGTIIYYSFFYTLYLKPRTPYNIVIGGAAGSMAPVIAWVAVSGHVAITPILLFSIIFLWTPPHFWALALYMKEDYERVNYPMMPIVRGEPATRRQILLYTLALVGLSAVCIAVGAGAIFAFIAATSGALFIKKSVDVLKARSNDLARGLFGYSIIYLFTIFIGLILDSAVTIKF